SVEESSFDAWTKFYKQDANASNAIVSYYAKGAMIALSLDLKLRAETEDRVSLDDVMQECWRRWGGTGEGMPERGFESVCDSVSGLELGDFFDAAVRGTGDLPLESLLQRFGVSLNLRASSGGNDKGGKNSDPEKCSSVWLGATLAAEGGHSVFKSVSNGGPAELAGIAPGDRAVALDGVRLTAANVDRRLCAYRNGDVLELVAFRGDELITTSVRLTAPPEDTCYLELIGDIDAETLERRAAWLHG
ncbi:MAG: PDZ domain-containing protein, partial [Woeseiaceae bacterium]